MMVKWSDDAREYLILYPNLKRGILEGESRVKASWEGSDVVGIGP